MKLAKFLSAVTALTLSSSLMAGDDKVIVETVEPEVANFDSARRPITNPTLFDLALPRTQVHFIYMHHRFPDRINIIGGGQVPMGGDLNLYALQLEYAFTERISLVASKDGYVDFNPDSTFTSDEGWANLAAGLKYAFLYLPEKQYAMSVTGTIEVPTGSRGVFQGEGDGSLNLSVQNVKMWDKLQLASSLGLQVPFDSSFATSSWLSAHVSYEVVQWFIPLIELNWFYVWDSGDGGSRYANQVGGAVPAVATFEGADLLNWGAANSDGNSYVTAAIGFRSRITDNLDLGFAYELPLTDEEDNITKDRFTVDLIWTF